MTLNETSPLADLPYADEFEAMTIPAKVPLEEEIIARASGNHAPMPMLDVIFTRMITAFSPMLKSQTTLLTETRPMDLSYQPWGETINSLDPNGVAAMAQSSWGGSIALYLDSAFLHAAIVTQLGGKVSSADIARRLPTTIEKAFAKQLIVLILNELAQHVSRITEVAFTPDSVEGPAQLSSFLAANAVAAVCSVEIEIGPVIGCMKIILPMQTLEPVRTQLSKMFLGEKLGVDTGWRRHFAQNISDATMPLTVELHRLEVPLADILGWRPGVTLDLGITTDQEATVICSNRPILHGATGRRRNGRVALRVTREAGEAKEGSENDDLLTD